MYLCMLAIMRFVGRRQTGHFGPADLLVIVMIADAAQNGLGKDYSSVTEGVTLVLTIVSWEYFLDWLSFRFPSVRPILKLPSLKLIQNGRLEQNNLRKEMLTEEELRSQLRELEIENYNEVKLCTLEGDGRLSVLRKKADA
jgi:uncharacterized membrane protein YcaP (DUF421 family)